jgi:hypothetical protein
MDRSNTESQLTAERKQKFQGTAKVNLDQIVPHPSISPELDMKNVDRLCGIFKDLCRREDIRNHGLCDRCCIDTGSLRRTHCSTSELPGTPG